MGFVFETAKNVRFLIDQRLLEEKALIFHPLENTSSIRMDREVFFRSFLPSVNKEFTPVSLD